MSAEFVFNFLASLFTEILLAPAIFLVVLAILLIGHFWSKRKDRRGERGRA